MSFRLPTRVVVEPGALSRISELISDLPTSRILLVFDEGLKATGWPSQVRESLDFPGSSVLCFDTVEPNPRASTVDAAADLARSEGVDLVVGLGGGSVLDAAKAVAMLINNPGSCTEYEGRNRFEKPAAPFVAIPTTCGTGSEVTWVSVISDRATRRKISVKGDGMYPSIALVDADLLKTLPSHLIAETGMDALTHAVEAFVSRFSCPVTDLFATEAIRLLLTHLETCFRDPEISEPRAEVMKASTVAGMAFGNADVGAVHCLSESIGGLFDHPHGLLNAMLMVPVLQHQLPAIRDRIDELGRDMNSPKGDLLAHIQGLSERLGIPPFRNLDVPSESFGMVTKMAVQNGSNHANRMQMKETDYLNILETVA